MCTIKCRRWKQIDQIKTGWEKDFQIHLQDLILQPWMSLTMRWLSEYSDALTHAHYRNTHTKKNINNGKTSLLAVEITIQLNTKIILKKIWGWEVKGKWIRDGMKAWREEELLFQRMRFEFKKKTWKNRQTVQTFIITITSLAQPVSFLSSIFLNKFQHLRHNIKI